TLRRIGLGLPPDRTHSHVKSMRPSRQRLADVAESENTEGLACEFRPQWRRRHSDRPLTLPFSRPQLVIHEAKAAAQSDHRSNDGPRDAGLMSVGIGERKTRPKLRAVDAIETGARHLYQTQLRRGGCHGAVKPH